MLLTIDIALQTLSDLLEIVDEEKRVNTHWRARVFDFVSAVNESEGVAAAPVDGGVRRAASLTQGVKRSGSERKKLLGRIRSGVLHVDEGTGVEGEEQDGDVASPPPYIPHRQSAPLPTHFGPYATSDVVQAYKACKRCSVTGGNGVDMTVDLRSLVKDSSIRSNPFFLDVLTRHHKKLQIRASTTVSSAKKRGSGESVENVSVGVDECVRTCFPLLRPKDCRSTVETIAEHMVLSLHRVREMHKNLPSLYM